MWWVWSCVELTFVYQNLSTLICCWFDLCGFLLWLFPNFVFNIITDYILPQKQAASFDIIFCFVRKLKLDSFIAVNIFVIVCRKTTSKLVSMGLIHNNCSEFVFVVEIDNGLTQSNQAWVKLFQHYCRQGNISIPVAKTSFSFLENLFELIKCHPF